MKYIIAALLIASCTSIAQAQDVVPTEASDTLLNVESPSRIVITETEYGNQIFVNGKKDDEAYMETITTVYPATSEVSARQSTFLDNVDRVLSNGLLSLRKDSGCGWDVIVDGVCIGLTKSTGIDADYGPEWSKSLELCWMNCFGVSYNFKRGSISLGLGFDWRNYRTTTSAARMAALENGGISLVPYPEGVKTKFSRLKVFSLQLPLLYRLNIPGTSLNMKVGPIFNFNTYASLKTTYELAESHVITDFTKDIKPQRFTVDFFGSIAFCHFIGVYVRYSPMNVMKAENSLNFHPLTLGVTIGL